MRTAPPPPNVSVTVTGENATDVLRALDESAPGGAAYAAQRAAAARWAAQRGVDRINDGDYEGAVRLLRSALVAYSPEDLAAGGLPDDLGPLARAVLQVASERGNEGRAIAANRVLAALTHPDADASSRLRAIHEWGDRNRAEFQPPWIHLGEMADVYKEVARIIPAPDVLARVTELMVGRQRAALEGRPSGRQPPRNPFEENARRQEALQRTPVDLALVFLRIGDVQRAADELARLHNGAQGGLARALSAIAGGEGAADGLVELAGRLERVDPSASAGVCRRGRREYPNDARFAQCLAMAAAHEDDAGLASAHFEAAVRLSPNDQRLHEAALVASMQWFGRELASDDPLAGRRAYQRTGALLALWGQRFPRQPARFTEGDIEEFAAQLELGQANLRGAQEHLERAMRATPPARDAYGTMAEIAWRHRDGRRAIEVLRQGLALPLRPTEADSLFRPSFTLRIGLAAQTAGDTALAQQSLTDAAAALDALSRSVEGRERGNALYWRAVALDALGQRTDLHEILSNAIDADSDNRDLVGRTITFSLSRGRWADASEFYRTARGTVNLDRPWQVYFALWGAHAARIGRLAGDNGAANALEAIARSAANQSHPTWTARLALRFAGTLTREQLLAHAQTPGQRAEALFYEALGELASGDAVAAERDLRAVVATEMLRYFEYEMSWDMLERGVSTLVAPAATPGTAANPGTAATPGTAANPGTAATGP